MKLIKNIYLSLGFWTIGGLCLTSCEDILTEKPDSYYSKEDFFINAANAEMAVTGIYSILTDIYDQIDGQNSAASDDILYPAGGYVTDNARRDMGNYTLTNSNKSLKTLWNNKYEQLNRANYCIQNIEAMEGYAQNKNLQRLVGKAKFLRALAASDLARYWGDVPFKAYYTDSYESAYMPRIDRQEIYDQAIQDLNDAKKVLPWADASTSPEKITQGAARALLMRVLLTRAGYSLQMDGGLTRPDDSKRKEYFEAVIDEWEAFEKNGYHGFYEGGYEALFRSFSEGTLNSRESLFEIAFYYPTNKGTWGVYMGPSVAAPNVPMSEASKYMGRAGASFRAVPEWRKFYETADQRRDVSICTYAYTWDNATMSHIKTEDTKGRNWYPGKWRREWTPSGSNKNLNASDINYCLLRYGDVVLMAAEAYNETGNTAQAWKLLNRIRERAGATQAVTLAKYREAQPNLYNLPFFNSGDEKDNFRTALYWERGLELAFEGQRKYDLIRWGVMAQALKLFGRDTAANSGNKPAYIAPTYFQSGKHELFPIPLDEIQINHKLEGKNNPGY